MASSEAAPTRRSPDRISALSDDVLCCILSFLPTKYSIRTSVLSTRWKFLFNFVPVLDLECPSFNRSPYYHIGPGTRNMNCSSKNFVNSGFSSYKLSHMNKLRLSYKDCFNHEYRDMVSLISFALCPYVQQVDISVFGAYKKLPPDLFNCKTLSTLKLDGCVITSLPSSPSLPCLRTFHLKNALFDGDSARRLFHSCPVLEDLALTTGDIKKDVEVLVISVSTLKSLKIHERYDEYQLVLDVPNLIYFEYVGKGANEISGGESCSKSLINAHIKFQGSFIRDGNLVPFKNLNMVLNVERLNLLIATMEAKSYSNEYLPTFNNLTKLELDFRVIGGSDVVLKDLLEKSPQLEVLVFTRELSAYYWYKLDADSVLLSELVPACVSRHLKEIEFKWFFMCGQGCKVVEYFLKNAKVLDRMKIRLCPKDQSEIRKKLLAFSRCSEACQIVFSVY